MVFSRNSSASAGGGGSSRGAVAVVAAGVATGMSSSLAEEEESDDELMGDLAAGCVAAEAAEDAVAQEDLEQPEQLLPLEDDEEADRSRASRRAFFRFPS